jgi:hypothetical protein
VWPPAQRWSAWQLKGSRVPNRWYVKKDGQSRGPYPSGALVQDRLVGRLGDADLISADQIEWKPFSAWPELVHAMTASPLHGAGSERDEWLAERNNARARWADQRTGDDRREAESAANGGTVNRREGETDRRMDPALQRRQRPAARNSLSGNLPVWALVVGLVVIAALVAVLVSVFGAVNPVQVRLR